MSTKMKLRGAGILWDLICFQLFYACLVNGMLGIGDERSMIRTDAAQERETGSRN